ncbi:MAG: MBL fold metallo-hydrolase [Saprospiraceae bacterium]
MKINVLGTGTSQGIPVIGCSCAVCRSRDLRDKRLRTSVMVSDDQTTIVIDVGPDFRQQMLRESVQRVDAILLTHEHNDHVSGLDDVRPYNFMTRKDMPVYGLPRVLEDVRQRFRYIFEDNPYPGAPRIKAIEITPYQSLEIGTIEVLPLRVHHGSLDILGFLFPGFAYLTDVKSIPVRSLELLSGIEILIISALHHKAHHSHLNLREALDLIERIGPRKCYLTHMSHEMGLYAHIQAQLPLGVELAYDGLEIEL